MEQFTPAFYPPFGQGPNQVCQSTGPGGFTCTTPDVGSAFPAILTLILLFWLAGFLLALYVSRDMDRRGQNGCLWGALVFFGGWIGIIFWLIQRRQYPRPGE